ncbi:MAG: hypothetical protein QF381_03985 [Nitrososphaerales archaeon]|jgi:hypothetical protein|nr:hypothetical protein [Nitrososphaerales archaeon]|tara:strand:- start:352 stop:567 length:216 start_codon:yes stop_codon:yes gene_type:complete
MNAPSLKHESKIVDIYGIGSAVSLCFYCEHLVRTHIKGFRREDYGPVEDIHMIMDHLLANWLQWKLKIDNQ